jgi:hypothetical protein
MIRMPEIMTVDKRGFWEAKASGMCGMSWGARGPNQTLEEWKRTPKA